ncbi:sigma-54-dependent Fis family transcriptional regulator [Stygiobacter electus]|jgi:transcriptional regulator with GAF, ATPase, and Fis domain|uniref:Sigma 54-interacting transcriptional regulator n=1 Tax=Stygiobacter electus TaxID=3032292 RepID=A0AAE3P0U3_9BACT|nr:sigma 54-interacting transcriptional regulator [Stygiobacter electus]MDF1612185.1 sigma 54-interacting transcriptional regulator [Stygiobacter electus]
MTTQDLIQKDLLFLSPQKTMEIVLDTINEIIPYELAVILSKENNKNLKVRFSRGPLATDKIKNYEVNLEKHPEIIDVLNTGKVKLVEETNDPNHHDTYEEIMDLPIGHSCLLAPLRINGETLGLMTLDHSQCDMFTPQRVSIANSLTKLIALALAQSIANDSLINEKETLLFERTSLIGDISSVLEGLIGNSPIWLQVIEKIKLVAPTDSHVMILGETGTGKEQVAKAIHALSKRNQKPFITLNCSALNYNLAESELFGHEKGAYTGAVSTRRGRFELANGGTLFLDEIGDLPFEIQPKLLRAIQEGTFERLGSEKTIHADVRIICATNVDLETKVKEGKFREDLYYRLNVFPILLPPLRKRKEDIYLLSNYFLEKLKSRFINKNFVLTKEALEILTNNIWYGNVRELQNTLERAAILSKDGVIKATHIIFEKENYQKSDFVEINSSIRSFEEETKKIIVRALKLTNGKIYGKDGAAELLKMKPTTLQSKIKKLKIIL